jgi:hypothetical protein
MGILGDDSASTSWRRALAHVAGLVSGPPLRLDRDVEALVLDPAFRGTEVADAAAELPFPTVWHHGFVLPVDVLANHSDYRGEDVVRAGKEIAEGGMLDARVVGEAVRSGCYDGQLLKRLWHCVARHGHACVT